MKSQNTIIEEMKAKHAREMQETESKIALVEMMQSAPVSPCIANLRPFDDPASPYSGHGTISFSSPAYDPEKTYSPLAVAKALENDGWKLLPASRVKWGSWRRSMDFGAVEDLPEKRNNDELTDCEPALPVWVNPQQFTNCEVECWMQSPGGSIHQISIDIPRVASLSARKVEFTGGWRYERGTGKANYPATWETLFCDDEPYATRRDAYCVVDTDQGLSGRITWQLDAHEQKEFPLSLSDIMKSMGIS